MTKLNRFNLFVDFLKDTVPTLNIKYKNNSLFMKILGFILFFNKDFMSKYTTTIGSTIYFPSKEFVEKNPIAKIITVSHEARHIVDSKRYGVLFSILYLMPQLLALLLIPLLFVNVYLALFCLLFLLPLPAYFRMRFEILGYTMSLFVINELLKENNVPLEKRKELLYNKVNNCNEEFTSSKYYYMWPFGVEDKLKKAVVKILNETIVKEHVLYLAVKISLSDSK